MIVIEVAGVFSSGKSTLVDNLLRNKNVITIQQILPIWWLIKFLNDGFIKNVFIELYFLIRFNFKLAFSINKLVIFDVNKLNFIYKIKFYRSVVRKLGFIFEIRNKLDSFNGKFLLIDEGFYQLVQNSVTLSDSVINHSNLFHFNYRPDLLIITTASEEVIFNRSMCRLNLTGRYKQLSKDDLKNVISMSINSFNQLSIEYVKNFKCDMITVDCFSMNFLNYKGVILLKND